MKSYLYAKNKLEQMPVYNRNYGHDRLSADKDIALQPHRKQNFLERQIKSNDTLQSIALEFNVTVDELKRINSIHKENEIHARNVIKVPCTSLSLLLEQEYFKVAESPAAPELKVKTNVDTCDILIESVKNSSSIQKVSDETFPDEDRHTERMPLMTDDPPESVSLLTPSISHSQSDIISCNGADWGISWPMLIIIVLVIGFGGPILYVFWIMWGKPEKNKDS